MNETKSKTRTEALREALERRYNRLDRIAYRFRQNPASILGLALILMLVLVALFAPVIAPYPQDAGYQGDPAVNFDKQLEPPSSEHIFGTDNSGRDIFSRVVFGTQLSLTLGLTVLAFAIGVGVPVGLVAGYMGGPVSIGLMRIADVFLAIPPLVIALTVSVALEPSLRNVMLALAVVWWPWYARLVYGEVVSVREEAYVEASRGIGASTLQIIFREILPNVLAPVSVKFSLDMGYAIIIGAGLGFLGLGAQPPTPEWGTMISQGRAYLPGAWWYSTFPGLAIFIAVLGFNFLGDGLRDMLDTEVN